MNAAETIAAAIERLATWRRDAVWTYSPENMDIIANATTVALGVMPPDGDRIVTLHRTIGPQLGFLRAILDTHLNSVPLLFDEYEVWPIPAYALDLARAILGVES